MTPLSHSQIYFSYHFIYDIFYLMKLIHKYTNIIFF